MASSKKYEVQVDTKIDQKALDALIKKLKNLKANAKVGVEVDSKELKKLEQDIKKIVKPIKLNIDTNKTKQDLTTIERQIDKINSKAKGVKTGGGVGGRGGVGGGIGMDPLLMSIGSTDVGDIVAARTAQQVGQLREEVAGPRKRVGTVVGLPPALLASLQKTEKDAKKTSKAVDSTTQSVKGLTAAVVGNEAIEKVNFLLMGMATNYRKTADIIEDTNAELAESHRETAKTLESTIQLIQGGFGGAIAGAALGGKMGGAIGAGVGAGVSVLGQGLQKMAEAEIMVAEANKRLIDSHKEVTKSFNDYAFKNGVQLLEDYNKTLEHTITLENELTSVKLHAQDEELAGMYDTLQLEKERIENKKKLISESGRPEAQKIQEIATLNEQLDYLQNIYDVESAGAPVKRLQTTLSGLSDTFTPIVEAIQETSDNLSTVKGLNKQLEKVDTQLTAIEKEKRSVAEPYRVLSLAEPRLMAEKSQLKKQIEQYATEEQLQEEIKTLQEQKDSLQKSINAKGLELDLALITEARVKANLEAQGVSRGQTRNIEKVSQLSTASTDGQLQARLETGVSSLVNTITGVSETFERLKIGTSVSRGNELTNLENAISEAIKDGIISVKDFNPIYNKAQGMGIGNDPGVKDILDKLRKIAEVQLRTGTGNTVNVAAQQAIKSLGESGVDNQVSQYIQQIVKDREINAEELAGLQELLSTSNAKGLEVINRLLAVAESNLTANTQLIDRIAKIEAGLKTVTVKLK
jgi:hypothetical protein